MIQVLITAAIILGFLKLSDKKNVIDYFGAFTIYLAPLAFVWVAGFAINSFELPELLHFAIMSAFFIGPFLIINAICESYSTRKKALLSLGVFAIVIVMQVLEFLIIVGSDTQVR